MKRFSFFLSLAIGIFATAFMIQSCQKEQVQVTKPGVLDVVVGDRAPYIYGVTVFSAGHPSNLVTMDAANGNVTNAVAVYVLNALGNPFFLDDLKGVCVVNDQVWVSTGYNAVDAYSNLLIKVNPATGQAGIISHSDKGTVSDIDYDAANNIIYGLANNGNRLMTIQEVGGNNWATYTVVGNITNLGGSYVAKGLSMAPEIDNGGIGIAIAATQASGGNANMYKVPAAAGNATFLAAIIPANELATGHCGIGYDVDLGSMLINRRTTAPGGLGLNIFEWNIPLANPTNSQFWGGADLNFEDVSSDL